jgi:pimeloyl-ACP methyl ester carboxylesterase
VSPLSIVLSSPLFKWSDLVALVRGTKANKALVDFLGRFNLNAEPTGYEIPLSYIMGEDDWQTPAALAQEYFARIQAPDKRFFLLPHAGHMAMVDQPTQFLAVLSEMRAV